MPRDPLHASAGGGAHDPAALADLRALGAVGIRISRERARWRREAAWTAQSAVGCGVPIAEVARLLGVTRASVYAWLRVAE